MEITDYPLTRKHFLCNHIPGSMSISEVLKAEYSAFVQLGFPRGCCAFQCARWSLRMMLSSSQSSDWLAASYPPSANDATLMSHLLLGLWLWLAGSRRADPSQWPSRKLCAQRVTRTGDIYLWQIWFLERNSIFASLLKTASSIALLSSFLINLIGPSHLVSNKWRYLVLWASWWLLIPSLCRVMRPPHM